MAAYDLILRNALIFDGLGNDPVTGDIAVKGDRIGARSGTTLRRHK